jgi:hypothetical protein
MNLPNVPRKPQVFVELPEFPYIEARDWQAARMRSLVDLAFGGRHFRDLGRQIEF